jgi:hypothetical protein
VTDNVGRGEPALPPLALFPHVILIPEAVDNPATSIARAKAALANGRLCGPHFDFSCRKAIPAFHPLPPNPGRPKGRPPAFTWQRSIAAVLRLVRHLFPVFRSVFYKLYRVIKLPEITIPPAIFGDVETQAYLTIPADMDVSKEEQDWFGAGGDASGKTFSQHLISRGATPLDVEIWNIRYQ